MSGEKKFADWLHPLVDDLYMQPVAIVVASFILFAIFWAWFGGAAEFHIAMLPLYYIAAFSVFMFVSNVGQDSK